MRMNRWVIEVGDGTAHQGRTATMWPGVRPIIYPS